MRVPVSWLRAYCDPGLSTEEIGHRLAMSGTEPERIERIGIGSTENFVVGRVEGAVPHPQADRLKVCVVDVGEDDSRTIVCGAPNVTAGQTVAVALPGAVLANGQELGEVELRGVRSSGMILAEDEVGLGEDHSGIMVLPDGPPPGAPLTEHLPIADDVLDLEVNPNRPDCLAVYGVARELHAVTAAPLAPDPTDEDAPAVGADQALEHASVEIADPEICLRFTARVFEDVEVGPSPMWLRARLIAAGQRPISNVVDITNYVMLLTGQPLHAFDLDEVRGNQIVVRRARPGERMTTLDGIDRTFDESMALVCDAEGPSGIAGIMGGQVSEVSERTTRVLMEAATWVGTNILRTSSKLGLRSEASTRFEKQLHPELAMAAQRLASRLMVELCGARLVPGTLDAYPGPAPPRSVPLHLDRLEKLLGEEIKGASVHDILQRLGFASQGTGAGFEVTVPYWRDADVQREVDLIEEVARIHGLENLPITLPARRRAVGRLSREQRLRRRIEDGLRDRGLCEIVAYSFTAPEVLSRLGVTDGALPLANPLSEDASVMRPLLLPGLLDAARHNAAHGRPGVALFESAHVYRPGGSLEAQEGSPRGATPAAEEHHLAGLLTRADPGSWRSEPKPADFYAARALVEALLGSAGVEWRAEPAERPFLQPGRAAQVIAGANVEGAGGDPIGWIGEVHPRVARAWDLDGGAAFELDAQAIARLAPEARQFADIASFPAVLQDIAVVVPEDVSAATVEEAVRAGGGDILEGVRIFDLYRGDQVGAGSKSLALRLEFRAPDRTLTDEEVAERRAAIERELERIGGSLRA
jgi:phenylalanyl-tRNA synthetase beta chain